MTTIWASDKQKEPNCPCTDLFAGDEHAGRSLVQGGGRGLRGLCLPRVPAASPELDSQLRLQGPRSPGLSTDRRKAAQTDAGCYC